MISLSRDEIYPWTKGKTYGWGSEKINNPKIDLSEVPMSTILKEIEVKILGHEKCKTILRRELKANEVCAKGIGKYTSAAQVINFDQTYPTGICK